MTEAFNCVSCGAPLDGPANRELVQCSHCQVINRHRLVLDSDKDSVGQKAAIKQLQDTNQRLEQEIRDRQLHQELEALDRHWAVDRQRLRPQDNAVVPILLGLFGFGLVGVSLLASLVAPVFCLATFTGLPFLLISLIWYLSLRNRSATYRRAESHYFHYRQQMINRWSAASQPS